MTENPCRHCLDRSATCHANCDKYAEWVKLHDKERKNVREYLFPPTLKYKADKIRKGRK